MGFHSRDQIVVDDAFLSLIASKTKYLITMLKEAEERNGGFHYTRPFLGRLNLESRIIEELLDEYGARHNMSWYAFRRSIAAVKAFSQIVHNISHISASFPCYRIISVKEDFLAATKKTLKESTAALKNSMENLLKEAEHHGLEPGEVVQDFSEHLPEGTLRQDRPRRHLENPGPTIVNLATTFLNLSEDTELFGIRDRNKHLRYLDYVPEPVSEARIRNMEHALHSLQSTYDTYLLDSDAEERDEDLLVLRGHVSTIFHLLETGTVLSHYYERHMLNQDAVVIGEDTLLSVLIDYILAFSSRFFNAARELCRNIIHSYAVQGTISVPVPQYRGFHVRPSTLVAKIVTHYGSDVTLRLNGQSFNAASPLELFRVNEAINAAKRKTLGGIVCEIAETMGSVPREEGVMKKALRRLIVKLLENHQIVMYEADFSLEEISYIEGETLAEFATRGIAHLLALGRIDIRTGITVEFSGDTRVLSDLKLLAENGYGEDNYGNNIMLPAELSYLRR
ncbi:HPr family phosphocarrier protein [Marispirochaeta aestuarii]|uniref:HPr family phosphocarrier protein n=1 Tax=Marispirochaeta aestuarii TaxID=1963862 RepID=UPI0029C64270|nr:HPr family phosphocarrier protein [Marispirochaeta aestuarii]